MRGAPSQFDTFDYKPELARDPWRLRFQQHGQSGLWISEAYPHLAQHADELCLLHGLHTDTPVHNVATVQLHTGSAVFARPSMGAWILYGLGTENQNLPGFVAMCMPSSAGGAQNYGSSFLPAAYQGTPIGRAKDRLTPQHVRNVRNPNLSRQQQRLQLDLAREMNQQLAQRDPSNGQLDGVIESFELAFRMQSELPRLLDFSTEPRHVLDLYGMGERRVIPMLSGPYGRVASVDQFARQCLLARRLVEAGVRFVELNDEYWDTHGQQRAVTSGSAWGTDRPIAALLTDLKQRGLLEDTLVLWGGEFGRTVGDSRKNGSEHNPDGFTMRMAGGGVKGGFRYSRTEEHGQTARAVEGRMHLHDLHATILHILGLDHTRLTYRYAGRDFRLTDVHGNVARDIFSGSWSGEERADSR